MAITLSKIGTVKHYYDKIKVVIIELLDTLQAGDTIRFIRGGEDQFDQKVHSLHVEHKEVERAGAGETIGLKVDSPLKEMTEVFLIEQEK